MKAIKVTQADGGWIVRSEAIDSALVFRSGAAAESAAIRLAQGWADSGEEAQVDIHARDRSLVRRFTIPALNRLHPKCADHMPS